MNKNNQDLKAKAIEIQRIINDMFIDFNLLASKYPKLYPHLVILDYKTAINFKKQQSLIILAEAIMACIFKIRFKCPENNLCPRIPNRLNYLMWVYKYAPVQIQRVLDIGTGATVIYPLLGWAMFKWNFLSTQINAQSLIHAQQLIRLNNLSDNIKIIKTEQSEDVFNFRLPKDKKWHNIDIAICNPPFYSQAGADNDIYNGSSQLKLQSIRNQNRNITDFETPLGKMLKSQFACEGGQYSFFFNMYTSSFKYVQRQSNRDANYLQVKCFSCLLGRQSSFTEVCNFLTFQMRYGVLQYFKAGQIRQGQNARFIVLWKPKSLN